MVSAQLNRETTAKGRLVSVCQEKYLNFSRLSGALGAVKMARCYTCVVDQMVLDIVGQALPGIKTLLELGVCNVARHDQSSTQGEARLDRVLGEGRTDLHRCEIV